MLRGKLLRDFSKGRGRPRPGFVLAGVKLREGSRREGNNLVSRRKK